MLAQEYMGYTRLASSLMCKSLRIVAANRFLTSLLKLPISDANPGQSSLFWQVVFEFIKSRGDSKLEDFFHKAIHGLVV